MRIAKKLPINLPTKTLDNPGFLCYYFIMNNPMNILLGKTFEQKSFSIGNDIEILLGGSVNKIAGSDFEVWEIKSKKIDAKSPMTLGGKNTLDKKVILDAVYNKMSDTILVWYEINDNKTFTVIKIEILFNINKERFYDIDNNFFYFETRKCSTTIRISKKHFYELYKNKIVYEIV